MADYTKAQERFHLIAGTLLSGKIFTEYGFLLKDDYDTKVKGETTKLNRLTEAMAKTEKIINILQADLIAIGCDLGIAEKEVENIETVIYAIVKLSPENQKRVLGLVKKIEQHEELKAQKENAITENV